MAGVFRKLTDLGISYSARGEIIETSESTPNSGGYFSLCAAYWPNGALKSLDCLAGLPEVVYGSTDGTNSLGLDGEGRVTNVWAQSGTNPLAQNITYYNGTAGSAPTQPIGALTQVTYGSGDFDNFSYNVSTNQVTGYQFNVGTSGQAVVGALTWNNNGSLQSLAITDPFNTANAQTCNYTHDELSRIASVNCINSLSPHPNVWNQTFTSNGAAYDAFGNLQKAVPSGGTGITFAPTYDLTTNRIATLPGGSPTYDANGNLTNDLTHTYASDTDGDVVRIDSIAMTYDALDRLVEQNATGGIRRSCTAPAAGVNWR